jgi:ketosteroid isomerase-like protein
MKPFDRVCAAPLAAACLLLSAASAAQAAPKPDPVVAAERAFAARAQEAPIRRAFDEYAAEDSVAVGPNGAASMKARLRAAQDEDDKGYIQWWPSMSGVSASEDLGFSTGPSVFGGGERYGNYFTIWRKQADGSWKWILDIGAKSGGPYTVGKEDPVKTVKAVKVPRLAQAAAEAQVRAAEAALASELPGDPGAAYARRLAPEGRLIGLEAQPVDGKEALKAAAERPMGIQATLLGAGASAAGDLAYAYGTASWTEGEKTRKAAYLRVWQRRPQGWVILVDNISPFREPRG